MFLYFKNPIRLLKKTAFLVCFQSLFLSGLNAQDLFTYPQLQVQYDSAITFRNLKIIPVKRLEPCSAADDSLSGSFLTLKRGMRSGQVLLKERGNYMVDNINVLLIENKSKQNLHIKSGEIVIGGYQDRVFAKDTILPPSSTPYAVPVYCIEENRWSKYAKRFGYGGNTSSGLQWLIDSSASQTIIWNEIRKWVKESNQSSSSFAAVVNNKKMSDTLRGYLEFFLENLQKTDSNTVGIIASTGDKILGADVLISSSLFYQILTNLLEKYCLEAIRSGALPDASNKKEIMYANRLFSASTQQEQLDKKGKRIFFKGTLIQITGH
jgi:hypothetical protein